MNWINFVADALTAMPSAPDGQEGGGGIMSMLPMLGMIAILYYFLLYMPQKRKQQERDKLLGSLERGDEVMTAGGIYGKVTGVTETVVTVEIAPKVYVKVSKSHVGEKINKTEGKKAEKEKADTARADKGD